VWGSGAAWSALVHAGRIQAGETVLITGALGAVGHAATQIAHWKKPGDRCRHLGWAV